MRLGGIPCARRLGLPFAATAVLTAGGLAQAGIANAVPATFDDEGSSHCTATNVPGPDESLDGVVTACCVQYGGIPAPTTYGMGCVAPLPDNMPADFRPTIVMPTLPMPDSALSDGDLLGPPIEGPGPPLQGPEGMAPPIDGPSP
jgi:hypothetical protein